MSIKQEKDNGLIAREWRIESFVWLWNHGRHVFDDGSIAMSYTAL